MSKTRNNHYVPQWYQEGFFEIGRSTLAYLDMKPAPRDYAMHKAVAAFRAFEAGAKGRQDVAQDHDFAKPQIAE
jgi:hypothetical protein